MVIARAPKTGHILEFAALDPFNNGGAVEPVNTRNLRCVQKLLHTKSKTKRGREVKGKMLKVLKCCGQIKTAPVQEQLFALLVIHLK